jgi:hypothetical protein
MITMRLTSLRSGWPCVRSALSPGGSAGAAPTGPGAGLGASRLTNDIVNLVEQAPAIFEALTGQKVSYLMSHVPVMNDVTPDNPGVNGQNGATVETNAQDEDNTRVAR